MKKTETVNGWSDYPLKKTFLIMRIIVFLLLATIFQTYANDAYSQRTKLSLNFNNTALEQVLDAIENQSEFFFLYNEKLVDVKRKVSVKGNDKSINEILNSLFEGTDVEYSIVDRKIVLAPEDINEAVQQNKTVSGKVTDKTGSPLPGVTVVVKGTTTGTITDMNGVYNLNNVPESSYLVFSFVGMRTQEIQVNNQNTIDIILVEETIGIDEVVAVGFGVQKKVNLTGAVSVIDFTEEIENRPITNASQALSGKIPGLWVSQNSGKPGADGAEIRVRGWGTLNNSNPLVLIDGVEGSFDQINPNDIENVSVLKDAASAAIYGSKAANGVILITTKTGKKEEDMQVTLSSYYGIQSLGRRYNLVTNSAEHMRITNQALVNEGGSPLFAESLISQFENGTDKYKYPNTDWYDILFENAPIQEHNLSVRGGTNKSTSFLSFNYMNQDGMVKNTNTERYGIRANMELDVYHWLKLDGRINYSRRTSNEPYNDAVYGSLGRVFEMLSGVTPYTAPYTRDGKFGSVEAISPDGNVLFDNRNPLIETANGRRILEYNNLGINSSATIDLFDFLTWRTTLASNANWNMIDNHNETVVGYTDSGSPMMTKNFNREGIEMSRNQVSNITNNLFSTLSFNKTFNTKHEISSILGMQIESMTLKTMFSRRTNPPKEGLTQVDSGTTGIQAAGNLYKLRMYSYFGRFNYSYLGKYLFEANLRADASSRFKEGNRWGIFPGFSAGWRIGDEEFIQNLDIFSGLKLRASWGQLGNQNIAGYWPYLTVINQNNGLSYSSDGTLVPGAAVTDLIDEDITWETSSTLDLGIDMSFLNNRISVEADYFHKITKDILVQLPIPEVLGGLTPPYENLGEMRNNGVEFTINYNNRALTRDKLGYNLGFNVTYIDNLVTKFQGGKSPDQLYLIREGYSYRTLYGYKVIGIYQTPEEVTEHMHSNSYKPKPGNLKFEDVNDDGKLGFEDRQDLGNTIPKLTFGFNSGFKYQGFDLNLLFQGVFGANGYNNNIVTMMDYENRTISTTWRKAWTPDNRNTNVPILLFNNSWDNQQSSYWVKDISFLKLKNIQLGYEIPQKTSSKLGIQKIYLFANAQNVFVLVDKDFEGYDPEKDSFSHGVNQYPVSRIISMGLNINF